MLLPPSTEASTPAATYDGTVAVAVCQAGRTQVRLRKISSATRPSEPLSAWPKLCALGSPNGGISTSYEIDMAIFTQVRLLWTSSVVMRHASASHHDEDPLDHGRMGYMGSAASPCAWTAPRGKGQSKRATCMVLNRVRGGLQPGRCRACVCLERVRGGGRGFLKDRSMCRHRRAS